MKSYPYQPFPSGPEGLAIGFGTREIGAVLHGAGLLGDRIAAWEEIEKADHYLGSLNALLLNSSACTAIPENLRKRLPTENLGLVILGSSIPPGLPAGLSENQVIFVPVGGSRTEINARLRAAIRSASPRLLAEAIVVGDLVLDLRIQRVFVRRTEVRMSPTERRILGLLMSAPGKVHSRDELFSALVDRQQKPSMRIVDVHIRNIRKALDRIGRGDALQTSYGVGYSVSAQTKTRESNSYGPQ